ncbi:kinesin light chain, partial [Haematococcus lacustris]
MAAAGRFFLHFQHKQRYNELVTRLRNLTRDNDMEAYLDRLKASAFGRFIQQPHLSALWNKHFMQEQSLVNLLATAEGKAAFMRAVELASDATKLREDEAQEKEAMDVADSILRSVGYGLEDKLMSMEAKLAPQSYFYLIDQPTLKAAWRLNFRHEQAVRWGLWWAVFPSSLPLNSTFDATTRSQLVDMLATTESRAAFKRAVSVEDSIYISIDELCRSFPDDRSLLLTTKRLVQIGRELVLEDQTLKQLEGKLKSMEARLAPQTYFHLIHQQDLQALWSTHFKHEQAVRWGLWWAVFPAKLDGLDAECKQELEGKLKSMEARLAPQTYFHLIHQQDLQALWSTHFKHEQAVRWGLWWAVFPEKLEGLPPTSKEEGPHCQLPQVNTEYWGREQQTQELGELLANSYGVLLLHGPPGIGKTCLAVDVGWHMWKKGCFPGKGSHCQLPQVNTENWGREQQIQELGELLANSYGVLLLHGPPGIGKTCLAVDVGWHMWEKGCLPGGAVLVPLKGAASARKQQQRLSEALGVHHVNDALDRIRSAGRMLLILDAAEACLLGVEVGAFVALLNT